MSNVKSKTSRMQLCDRFQYTLREIWEIARISNKIYKKYLSSELLDYKALYVKASRFSSSAFYSSFIAISERLQFNNDKLSDTKILKPFLVVYHSFCNHLCLPSGARANHLQSLSRPIRIENILPDEIIVHKYFL